MEAKSIGERKTQFLDDTRGRIRYCEIKEEAEDRKSPMILRIVYRAHLVKVFYVVVFSYIYDLTVAE